MAVPVKKFRAIPAASFNPAMMAAANIAKCYAADELGWLRATVEAGIQDPEDSDVFLFKLAVGETDNPDHDTMLLSLLVQWGSVTDEGDDKLWYDNAID